MSRPGRCRRAIRRDARFARRCHASRCRRFALGTQAAARSLQGRAPTPALASLPSRFSTANARSPLLPHSLHPCPTDVQTFASIHEADDPALRVALEYPPHARLSGCEEHVGDFGAVAGRRSALAFADQHAGLAAQRSSASVDVCAVAGLRAAAQARAASRRGTTGMAGLRRRRDGASDDRRRRSRPSSAEGHPGAAGRWAVRRRGVGSGRRRLAEPNRGRLGRARARGGVGRHRAKPDAARFPALAPAGPALPAAAAFPDRGQGPGLTVPDRRVYLTTYRPLSATT